MKLLTSIIVSIVLSSTCFLINFIEFRTPTNYSSTIIVESHDLETCEKDRLSLPVEKIQEPIIDEPILNITESSYITITDEEREMLAKLVYLEASVCSFDTQKAIVSVILNRLDSGCWKQDMNYDGVISLYDIIYYPEAFSPAHLIYKTTATQECYDAVDYVVTHGPTIPTYVRYFRIDYDFIWNNYANYDIMDNVYFGYFVNWEQGAW